MFSKNAKSFRSMSLATRLMFLYTLSTIGLLIAIGLFIYPTFNELITQLGVTEANNITTKCYKQIITILLFGSLFALILGHFISRKGLKRMRELEDKMEQITIDRLHEHIDLNDWPKELKSFGNKFNTMLDRIQHAFIQLSQFSSDIAHELRTPIHNLRGITEIALTKEKSTEEYKHILALHMNEYLYLSKLIENLLFLARSDHGQISLYRENISVQTEILNICDYYQSLADENNITLSCEGNARLSVDPILFRRIISNLVSNALKYTKTNGNITIKITPFDQQVEISIHDSGIGISDKHITRIFDRFYRVDSSRSAQSGGLGLGLAIVKSIVNLHQGELTIESKVDKGTLVKLQLPVCA